MNDLNVDVESLKIREFAEAELMDDQVKNHEQISVLLLELNSLSPIDKKYSDLAHRISSFKQTTDLYISMVQANEVLNFDQTELNFGDGVPFLTVGGYFSDTGVKIINASRVEELFPSTSLLGLAERAEYCRSRGYLIWGSPSCQSEISVIASNSAALWSNKISEKVKSILENK